MLPMAGMQGREHREDAVAGPFGDHYVKLLRVLRRVAHWTCFRRSVQLRCTPMFPRSVRILLIRAQKTAFPSVADPRVKRTSLMMGLAVSTDRTRDRGGTAGCLRQLCLRRGQTSADSAGSRRRWRGCRPPSGGSTGGWRAAPQFRRPRTAAHRRR